MPSKVLPSHLKQTFWPIVWIFTEGEGDDIKSKLASDIFFYFEIFHWMENYDIQYFKINYVVS